MNILNLSLQKSHFHSLLEYIKSGHTVYSNYMQYTNYDESFGIKILTEEENISFATQYQKEEEVVQRVTDLIYKYEIDILQVGMPGLSYLHTHFDDKIKYIGPPEAASKLETNKIYSKNAAIFSGVKVPETIKRGKYGDTDYATNLRFPSVEKPSHIWGPASVFYNEEDARIAREQVLNQAYPRYDKEIEYYIDEYIIDLMEINVFFAISNGSYVITSTHEIIGEGLNKTVEGNIWFHDCYFKPLEPKVDAIVRREASKYLEYIASLGGRYEGTFASAYTPKGEWKFLEMNARPDISNSSPTFMTGDEYLKGLFEDISLFEKAWKNINLQKLVVQAPAGASYPMHIHDKYNVAYPNNLQIHDSGEYEGSLVGKGHITGTIIADHNIPLEFIKEFEETTSWRFNEEPVR